MTSYNCHWACYFFYTRSRSLSRSWLLGKTTEKNIHIDLFLMFSGRRRRNFAFSCWCRACCDQFMLTSRLFTTKFIIHQVNDCEINFLYFIFYYIFFLSLFSCRSIDGWFFFFLVNDCEYFHVELYIHVCTQMNKWG